MKTLHNKVKKLLKRIKKVDTCALTDTEYQAFKEMYEAVNKFDYIMELRKPSKQWRRNELLADLFAMVGTVIILTAVLWLPLAWSTDRAELAECLKWESISYKYEGWYSTDWQKEQCITHGVTLK